MTDSKSARSALRQMFRTALPAPPAASAVVGNLKVAAAQPKAKSDRTEQLNIRVPLSVKKRVRVLATRDDVSLSEVIIRAVAAYEEKYGAAPEI